MVECQLPKLDVAGSNPVSRSNFFSMTLQASRTRYTHNSLIVQARIFGSLSPRSTFTLILQDFQHFRRFDNAGFPVFLEPQ